MLSAEQCREKAIECRELADHATCKAALEAYLLMADAWEEMALNRKRVKAVKAQVAEIEVTGGST